MWEVGIFPIISMTLRANCTVNITILESLFHESGV